MSHQTILFDTLRYAKKAKEVGFTEAQAEFQAEELSEIFNNKLATKHGLKEGLKKLEEKLTEKLNYTFIEFEGRIIHKVVVRIGAMLTATVSLLAVLMTMLHK